MASLVKVCAKCGEPVSHAALYCSACGAPQANLQDDRLDGGAVAIADQSKTAPDEKHPSIRRPAIAQYGWLTWVAAFILFCVLVRLGTFDKQLEWAIEFFSSPPELAIQVIRVDRVTANFGNLQITNISKQPVTLKHLAINNSEDPACSFDIDKALIFGKAALRPGESATIGTFAMMLGSCGTFFNLAVDTDKGSSEFSFSRGS